MEKTKGARRAAAELPCGVSADAEERGAVALKDARKKLEAVAATKARKRQKTTVTKATQVSPTSASPAPNSTIAADFPPSPDMPAVECDANPDKLEVLNSVCEETETEVGFYDDHDEWIRAIREDKETGDAPADDDSGDELIREEDLGFAPLAREECDYGQPLAGDTGADRQNGRYPPKPVDAQYAHLLMPY
ncbi:hypothetical protein PI124_g13898 [Phytophthora idaei]|nr:hypothetical protein PI125_g13557 [Phytophthora idaei]KAG3147981.1 hypothetical protein PI126_g12650 [Phytophthora idaei]KAG3241221.1 hypothetical protein PI124_g13898 [Phytophthora idaei]